MIIILLVDLYYWFFIVFHSNDFVNKSRPVCILSKINFINVKTVENIDYNISYAIMLFDLNYYTILVTYRAPLSFVSKIYL